MGNMINKLTGIILIIVSNSCIAFTISNEGNLKEGLKGVNFFITIQPNIYAISKNQIIYKVKGLDDCRSEFEISPGVEGVCDDNIKFKIKKCFMKRKFLYKKTDIAFIRGYIIVGIRVSGQVTNAKYIYFRNAILTQFIICRIDSTFSFTISGNIDSLIPTVVINGGEYVFGLGNMYSEN